MNIKETSPLYKLNLTINDKPVTMCIDSGCHNSIINKMEWKKLGKPNLSKVSTPRLAASGAKVGLMGEFTASVEYYGRFFELPLQVSSGKNTLNLIGRAWFPVLDLNWNRIFQKTDDGPIFREPTQQYKTIASNHYTKHFNITINVKGSSHTQLQMILDSGSETSIISMEDWKKLGKPKIKNLSMRMIDTAGQTLSIEGLCWVKIEHQSQELLLPLVVSKDYNGRGIIGTNWFPSLNNDFNTIFDGLEYFINGRSDELIKLAKVGFRKKGTFLKKIQKKWARVKSLFSSELLLDELAEKEHGTRDYVLTRYSME